MVADVLAAAPGRATAPVMPKIVIAGGAVHFLLPHDPEYATARPAADPESAKALIAATAATAATAAGPSHAARTGGVDDAAFVTPSTTPEQV
ncbi:hypothetical protein [Pseudofrankia sp. DC12]|uniref:hypothetical protein n=1 Tax=Pseudofrankia sp. DC12 TaxID=683315 RepID=UPI0005F76A9E|nr:hypothetical protein [Pseudofrankia sp. DC12]